MFNNGTPDRYYESEKAGYLWAEYKMYKTIPRTMDLHKGKAPKMSPLQRAWVNRAHSNEHNVCVVVGFGEGRDRVGLVLTDGDWEREFDKKYIVDNAVPIPEVAKIIEWLVTTSQR